MSLFARAKDLAYNPDHTRWMTPLLLIADAALSGVIIEKIPCSCSPVLLSQNTTCPNNDGFSDTEIDWTTYMQQISIYLKGERDYKNIAGSTGPLVYPGAHVWIYKHLYKWTDEGRDIGLAQYIFAGMYLLTLGVVFQCYRKARVSTLLFCLLLVEAGMKVQML